MSVIIWPGLKVSSFRWKKTNQAISFGSAFGSQSVDVSPAVWTVELSGTPQYWAEAVSTEVFLESLNGYTNQLELWNLIRQVPTGTMRGTMVFAADVAQGDVSIQISAGAGEAGKTLLKGDLIGFGNGVTQQVVRIDADAEADVSGNITVSVSTPVRNAFATGDSITWNKPKALFRQKSLNDGIEYGAVIGQPWSLSIIEDWRP
jgi:hypothetical protein